MKPPRHSGLTTAEERGIGPSGRLLCRCGCGIEPVPPRSSFVSQECVQRFLVQSDGQYARKAVFKRDKGICAECGRDCVRLWQELVAASPVRKAGVGKKKRESERGDPVKFRLLLVQSGLTESGMRFRTSCWDMDHIIEVTNGGGSCDLSNLQTLCCRCHREKTNRLIKTKRKNR